MTARQILDYSELLAIVRARIAEIDAPYEAIEGAAGLSRGYLATVVGPAEEKRLGLRAIWALLEALGLRMLIGEHLDREATIDEMGPLYRPTAAYAKRGKLRKRLSPAVVTAVAAELGRRGGSKAKRLSLSAAARSKIGRQNVRRRKWRPVQAPLQDDPIETLMRSLRGRTRARARAAIDDPVQAAR